MWKSIFVVVIVIVDSPLQHQSMLESFESNVMMIVIDSRSQYIVACGVADVFAVVTSHAEKVDSNWFSVVAASIRFDTWLPNNHVWTWFLNIFYELYAFGKSFVPFFAGRTNKNHLWLWTIDVSTIIIFKIQGDLSMYIYILCMYISIYMLLVLSKVFALHWDDYFPIRWVLCCWRWFCVCVALFGTRKNICRRKVTIRDLEFTGLAGVDKWYLWLTPTQRIFPTSDPTRSLLSLRYIFSFVLITPVYS